MEVILKVFGFLVSNSQEPIRTSPSYPNLENTTSILLVSLIAFDACNNLGKSLVLNEIRPKLICSLDAKTLFWKKIFLRVCGKIDCKFR
jgi:hypothetical protein